MGNEYAFPQVRNARQSDRQFKRVKLSNSINLIEWELNIPVEYSMFCSMIKLFRMVLTKGAKLRVGSS